MKVALVVPTWNAGPHLGRFIPAALALAPAPDEVLIVDSGSRDDTVPRCRAAGFDVHIIEPGTFGHGRTRNLAARRTEADILLFMTQDAVPLDRDLVGRLAGAFEDPRVGHAYARQVPHPDATPAAAFARRFNYPPESFTRTWADVAEMGVTACFTSNSCAAYRRSVFFALGGFDEGVPVSEDTLFAARMLRAGHHLRYVAEARVAHSHNYTWRQEFRRYFDIGVAHGLAPWYLELAHGVGGRGRDFVRAELAELLRTRPHAIPAALGRNAVRWLGYQAGRRHRRLPAPWRERLSGQPHFWRTSTA